MAVKNSNACVSKFSLVVLDKIALYVLDRENKSNIEEIGLLLLKSSYRIVPINSSIWLWT